MADVTPPTAASQGSTANVRNITVTNQLFQSTSEGLTAHAGGGQALATPITSMCARFTTVASLNDSSIMPVAVPGLEITVINAGAFGMNVYPDLGSQINNAGVNTPYLLAAGKTAMFFTTVAGAWHAILSA